VLHRSLLGQHVVEVRQRLEVGTQAFNGEALLERRPTQLPSVLGLSGGVKRVETARRDRRPPNRHRDHPIRIP
jgi:hypothetical protein